MKYVDAHAHLNFPEYDSDREAVIKKLVTENVTVINVGTDLKTSQEVIALTSEANFFATVGIHPSVKDEVSEAGWQNLKQLATHDKVVAIGECGLDNSRIESHSAKATQDEQINLFKKQIELALEVNKPLMLHVRDAYNETLDILNSYSQIHNSNLRGNVHFFVGEVETARKFLDLGFYLSFTGVITFASMYREVVSYVPLERIFSETDCPYAAPVPYRGRRNEPSYVIEVVKMIAQIKGLPAEAVADQIWANARALFGLEWS